MVSRLVPSHCTVSMVQDVTDMPSRSTVQAPQCEVSQPMCGPVCSSRSRSVWISSSRGSTATSTSLPFRVNDTRIFWAMLVSSGTSSGAGAGMGLQQRAARHLAGHGPLVVDVAALVGDRVADLHRQPRGFGEAGL